MNSLCLRVSSVKTGENVRKNAEIRGTIVDLPKKYSTSNDIIVEEFQNITTIPEQIQYVKKIYSEFNENENVISFITALYFSSPLKHPVRNQIAKLLQQHSNDKLIKEQISQSITDLISGSDENVQNLNFIVTSLAGCFENFPKAKSAIGGQLGIMVTFLWNSLNRFLIKLNELCSLSTKNEYYLYIHNVNRLFLSCIQSFDLIRTQSTQLKMLDDKSKKIVLDQDMPMDIKTNLGILRAYISQRLDKYYLFIDETLNYEKHDHCYTLCMGIGVINTLDAEYFQKEHYQIEKIIDLIIKIGNLHSTEPNYLLATARCLYQLTNFFSNIKKHNVVDLKNFLKMLLEFVYSYLTHHMDSVRHICKDLFRNILTLIDDDLILEIFQISKSKEIPTSNKAILLSIISQVLGAKIVMMNFPDLFTDFFKPHLDTDLNVQNCYENLMAASRKETDFNEWTTRWISFLIENYSDNAGANSNHSFVNENLINKAIKIDKNLIEFIIRNDKCPLNMKLSALWIGRKNNMKFQLNCQPQIYSKFSEKFLYESFKSNCDETKVMGLRFLIEVHKITEFYTESDFDLLLFYLEYNSNMQSPSLRQNTLALFEKALSRYDLNLKKILKDLKSSKNSLTDSAGQNYFGFMKKLLKLLLKNFFVGANFSRRTISLKIILHSLQILKDNELDLNNFLPEENFNTILQVLSDSYESNKGLAVEVLKIYFDYEFKKNQNFSIQLNLIEIENLMISVRPTDSLTAAYSLEFYCHSLNVNLVPETFGVEHVPTVEPIFYSALKWCMRILQKNLKIAEKSLMNGAKFPVYGCLFTMKHLISKLKIFTITENLWKEFVNDLILVCKYLTNLVGPIVNSDSPEGHLPNDFSELPSDFIKFDEIGDPKNNSKILSKKGKINLKEIKTTPQMVLLMGWRTVKEVSLLLGEIVINSPIQGCKDEYLVEVSQILLIGDHFKQLLAETKHRGAFEQAYVGFLKLTTRLWRIDLPDLNELPMKWLKELIDIISSDESINEKICSTRRSAGVPFMIQALIISELQVGTTKSLKFCMDSLLQICTDKHYSTEARTHSRNVLRALFRCTDLNETVGEFVSDGVICAINGYDADTWTEKNASTLLFSSLITRIFGVQRTKDSEYLNIRNRMTGRIFFLCYPKLYDFFLTELDNASKLIIKEEKPNKLHPLLLILKRLYPSSVEGSESSLKLSAFIPFVSLCSASPELCTRQLISKSIVSFVSIDVMPERIRTVMSTINACFTSKSTQKLNYTHGLLLQVCKRVKL